MAPLLVPLYTLFFTVQFGWDLVRWTFAGTANAFGQSTRQFISLDGTWQLSANGKSRDVQVPGTFEQQVAPDFDGVGVYERTIDAIAVPEHHRLLLQFIERDQYALKSSITTATRRLQFSIVTRTGELASDKILRTDAGRAEGSYGVAASLRFLA